MKVIFLDVDGVLNCDHRRQYVRTIDPIPTALLWHVVKQTGAKIVVSSTWRLGRQEELITLLTQHGIPEGTVIDRTPWLCDEQPGRVLVIQRPRSDEIRAWLAEHPEVTDYVIFDDGDDACIKGHFVRTTWAHGLEPQHAARAINILAGGNQGAMGHAVTPAASEAL